MQSSFDLDPSQMNSSFMLGRKICDNPVEVLEDAEAAHPAVSSIRGRDVTAIIDVSSVSMLPLNCGIPPLQYSVQIRAMLALRLVSSSLR